MEEIKKNENPAAAGQVIVKLQNATVLFRSRIVFSNLNLAIRKNQHIAVVGKPGTGKSALLQTFAGHCRISEGRLLHFPPGRKRAVYLDVRHDFKPLAGAGNFFYQQRFNAGYADSSPVVEDFLNQKAAMCSPDTPWSLSDLYDQFNLESVRHRHLIKLSSGEAKRLRIAAALLENPLLLLIDSPFAGLDDKSRSMLENIFAKIAQAGTSIITATNYDQIPKITTHIACLDSDQKPDLLPIESFNQKPEAVNLKPEVKFDVQVIENLTDHGPRENFSLLVSMNNINVAYGKNKILENISWQIRQGEHWALSGPNGSGKSTLLSLINGDHPQAYANDIILFDRKRGTGESIWDIKKKIGYMSPELFQYFPGRYSCLQVVESGFSDTLGMVLKKNKQHRDIAENWMKVMGLCRIKDHIFSTLPAGFQRMCLLARAVVKNPYLLLLDEPCQGLERDQQQTFRQLIDAMAQASDITIVYVTHQTGELPGCIQKSFNLG
jgi:molybdate transport system ATP-binding protein